MARRRRTARSGRSRASDVPVASRSCVPEPEDEERHDDRAAAHAEQRAECPRERADRGQPREPRGTWRAYYEPCPLPRPRRSLPPCDRSPRTPSRSGDPVRHRRHARADRDARRGGARARQGVAPPRAARPAGTGSSPASRGAAAADARRLVGVGGIAYAGSHGAELLEPGAAARAHLARVRELDRALSRASSRDARRRRAAPPARTDRAQGPDRRLPLARRARRGRRPHAARGDRARGGSRRARLPLGPQGAGDPAAGPGRQGPGRARAGRAERRARGALRRRRRHRPRRVRGARRARRREARSTRPSRSASARPRARPRSSDRPTRWSRARTGSSRSWRPCWANEVPRLPPHLRAAVRRRRDRARRRRDRRRRARRTTARSLYFALGWWGSRPSAGCGSAAGRRSPRASHGRSRARGRKPALPELEPGAILFNRLWALALFTVGSGAVAFLIPQIPAIAAGYVIAAALAWRKQSAAVEAIEGRDGVRFYVEHTSPFKPTRLIRTPGFRRVEPVSDGSASADDRARATRACSPRDPGPTHARLAVATP